MCLVAVACSTFLHIISELVAPNVGKLHGNMTRKFAVIGLSRLLTESTSFVEASPEQW